MVENTRLPFAGRQIRSARVDETSNLGVPTPNSMYRETRLNETFVELADTLVRGYDVADLLHTLASRCVEIFPAEEAAVLLRDKDDTLQVVASSSEGSRSMELLELEREAGPCVQAFQTGQCVQIKNLEAEVDRWPEYVKRGLELGYMSVDAIPIRLRQQNVGAIDLFYAQTGGAGRDDLAAMQSLANVAAIGLLQARAIDEAEDLAGHLEIALRSRILIEQAKGVTSEHLKIDVAEAFERIRRYSRSHSIKLTQVAGDIVDGALKPTELA